MVIKIGILKLMKISEIWQKFLNTRTANIIAICGLIDIPIFLIFLLFLIGIYDINEFSGLLYILLYTILIPFYLFIKLLIIIIIFLLEKFHKTSNFDLSYIDKKSKIIETILILINLLVTISITIKMLF